MNSDVSAWQPGDTIAEWNVSELRRIVDAGGSAEFKAGATGGLVMGGLAKVAAINNRAGSFTLAITQHGREYLSERFKAKGKRLIELTTAPCLLP